MTSLIAKHKIKTKCERNKIDNCFIMKRYNHFTLPTKVN